MNTTDDDAHVQKLASLIKNMDIGMLTTREDDGTLRSRPMSTNGNVEFDGDIWFFTYGNSHKVLEAQHNPQVGVSFSDLKGQTYVSLSGTAEIVRDKAKITELWEPALKAWFPKGVDEPDIALLKVAAHKAEYWDAPSSFIAHAISLAKVLTTGEPASIGDNQKLDLG